MTDRAAPRAGGDADVDPPARPTSTPTTATSTRCRASRSRSRQGEIVTLIGANGAGKTTTLKTISGLLHPREGTVALRGPGHLATAAPTCSSGPGIGQAPEGRRIFSRLTVLENLQMGAFTRDAGRDRARTSSACSTLFPRLQERLDQRGGTLSGGEQQMLAIGRALMPGRAAAPRRAVAGPGADPRPADLQDIREINAQGTTILLVEQNALQALAIAHRGYVLQTGEVVLAGHRAELMAERDGPQGVPRRGLSLGA